jgi:transcriptional regulator with XRE-family HTH domain
VSAFGYDGPSLRSVRESSGVTLRRVARLAQMSHGHLSKVERGEPGRPVTPAVLTAYEKATGVKLTGIAGHGNSDPVGRGWRRGHLSESRRRVLRAKIAAVAAGGELGDKAAKLLDHTGRLLVPDVVEEADVAHLEQVAALSACLDMRYGGGVADQLARAQVKWAIMMLDREASTDIKPRLRAAVACLAQRAGWAAFDADAHDVARSLFTVALYAATDADDPNLRAHVIADFAAQANFLGYPDDCLAIVRFAEVDERVGPHVRMVIHAVKARAHAMRGGAQTCQRQVELAEQAHADANGEPVEGWLATVAKPAQLDAGTGHALATLARRAESVTARKEAQARLAAAIDDLDPTGQARAAALCRAQLAGLHLEAGELDEGLTFGRQLLDAGGGIRSSRLAEHAAVVRRAAAAHVHEVLVKELVAEMDARWPPAAEVAAVGVPRA